MINLLYFKQNMNRSATEDGLGHSWASNGCLCLYKKNVSWKSMLTLYVFGEEQTIRAD